MKVPFPLHFLWWGAGFKDTVHSKRMHMGGWCHQNATVDIGLINPMCGVSSPRLSPIDSYSGYSYSGVTDWIIPSVRIPLSLPEGWVLAETGRKQLAQPLHNTLQPSILVEKQTWHPHKFGCITGCITSRQLHRAAAGTHHWYISGATNVTGKRSVSIRSQR